MLSQPSSASRAASPRLKSRTSGTWAKTLFATTRSRAAVLGAHPESLRLAQVGDVRRDALLDRDGGDVGRRLHAQHRHSAGDEVLQQVAVVAGHLDHQARGAEPESFDGAVDEDAGVFHPGRRVRGEVGVVREDVLGRHVHGQLHQQARAADPDPERVEDLRGLEPFRGDVALARRRHTQVDEDLAEGLLAEPAPPGPGRHVDVGARTWLGLEGRHQRSARCAATARTTWARRTAGWCRARAARSRRMVAVAGAARQQGDPQSGGRPQAGAVGECLQQVSPRGGGLSLGEEAEPETGPEGGARTQELRTEVPEAVVGEHPVVRVDVGPLESARLRRGVPVLAVAHQALWHVVGGSAVPAGQVGEPHLVRRRHLRGDLVPVDEPVAEDGGGDEEDGPVHQRRPDEGLMPSRGEVGSAALPRGCLGPRLEDVPVGVDDPVVGEGQHDARVGHEGGDHHLEEARVPLVVVVERGHQLAPRRPVHRQGVLETVRLPAVVAGTAAGDRRSRPRGPRSPVTPRCPTRGSPCGDRSAPARSRSPSAAWPVGDRSVSRP